LLTRQRAWREVGPPAPAATNATTTTSSLEEGTSTTFCGTCCHLQRTVSIQLEDDITVTELRFRVLADLDVCESCDAFGGTSSRNDDGSIDVCLFDADGLDGPAEVGSCYTRGGTVELGPVQVLGARGENFEPIEPPTVATE
jgi:hypothetical protein